MANKIRKDDQVIVISGSSKGKTGTVLSVKGKKAIVSGVNLKTIHVKPTQSSPGKIEKVEKPIDCSNLSNITEGSASKVSFKLDADAQVKHKKKKRVISKKKAKE